MQPDFRRIFEGAPNAFMVLAPDPPRFTIVAASDVYLAAVHKRREEFIGRPVFEALPLPPEDTTSEQASRTSFQRVIDTRQPDTMAVQRHDLKRPESEGGGFESHFWSPINTPILDDAGRVLYILHRVEDVTEYMQARQLGDEQSAATRELETRMGAMEADIYRRAREIQDKNRQLREANEKLAELDRAKTVFFSNVSHEFRTPLTLILGILEERLAADDLPDTARPALQTAHRNAVRLLRLVNTLLDFSRIEAGRMRATYRPTDLAGLTRLLASSFHSAAMKAGLKLVVDCPPLPAPVYVDGEMWEKIVLNLVSNAFKFTTVGEIEVRMRDAGDACELTVRDTGTGIPEAELPHVFERFFRADRPGGRSVEGSGIGLALVKELVELHGGRIAARSDGGKGTTMTVRLSFGKAHLPPDRVVDEPLRPTSAEAAHAYAEEALGWLESGEAEAAGAPEGTSRPRPRVIFADDNADMRAYLLRLLSRRFVVDAVADGQEALEAARRARPDLILSDVMMPRLDGFGLLRAVRNDPQLAATPFILVSARAGEEATGEGLEAGADDYLMKPFAARELVARVSANLKLAHARDEIARSRAREAALREADQRKNEFLAMLSHELRNPLAPIQNSLYVLARAAPGGEQARRAQETIDRQANHLSRLVDDLLDVSRITQGKLQIRHEPLELDEVVRGVVQDARQTFARAGVHLEARYSEVPLRLEGDATRLAQIVGNLLGNAAKFTPRGGHAWLRLFADEGKAVVSVKDDGAGLNPEMCERLFEPFEQADRTLDRSAGGLGLGLAVVKGLVEAHGGDVAAFSAGPGKGTEIVVRLPLRAPATLAAEAAPAARPLRSRRVLIVEDNLDAAESLKEVLELNGHEVAVAHSGAEGVARARDYRPDAVVCDIGLPDLDGYGVARALRDDPDLPGVRLVAVTGYAALDDVRRSQEAGFDYHLPKPPKIDVLEKLLEAR